MNFTIRLNIYTFMVSLVILNFAICQENEKKLLFNGSLFIMDGHVHNGLSLNNQRIVISDLTYFSSRSIDAIIYALPVDGSKTDDLMLRITEEIELFKYLCSNHNNLELIIEQNEWNPVKNKLHLFLAIEYFGQVFGKNPDTIKSFKDLGIRYITFTDNSLDSLFCQNGFLTSKGKTIISLMNKSNIVIDIAHLSENKMLQVINCSKTPVIASHSATKTVTNSGGNLTDEVLLALKQNKGYVLITFNKSDLISNKMNPGTGLNQILENIEYLKSFIDIDHIGIGSDYQVNGKYIPNDLNNSDIFKKLYLAMKSRDYNEKEIKGVMGINILNAINMVLPKKPY